MTTSDAQHFWANHPGQAAWCQAYAETDADPPRDWMLDAVRSFEGVGNVLEVGCHCGPVLHRLRELSVASLGIDINANAVAMAQRAGLNAIVGSVPSALERLPAKSFDLVLSSFCLAYIAPGDLLDVLQQCLRVARLGLVFVEPTAEPGTASTETTYADCYVEWRHSYIDAIERTVDLRFFPGTLRVDISCHRKPLQESGLNAVTIARLTWPS